MEFFPVLFDGFSLSLALDVFSAVKIIADKNITAEADESTANGGSDAGSVGDLSG
jgi:hypothetical protein